MLPPHVHDGEDGDAALLRHPQRGEGVGGLAGLGDHDHEGIFCELRVPSAELRGEIDGTS